MTLQWVNENKKEFLRYIEETYGSIFESKKTGTDKEMFKFQIFIREFLHNDSPYRGLLIYHGLGSGKTCTSIIVAENLKSQRNILVLLPASLTPNFQQSLISEECFTKNYKTINNIEQKYTFISYNASNHTLERLEQLGSLDNYVIIIDEAHTVINYIVNQSKIGLAIYKKIRNANNVKIILLTGTPIINKPFEAAIIMNMLKGKMYVPRFIVAKGVDFKNLDNFMKYLDKQDFVNYCEPNLKKRYFDIYLNYPKWSPNFVKSIENIELLGMKEFNVECYYNQKESKLYPLFPESENEFEKIFVDEQTELLRRKNILKRRMAGLVSYFRGGDKSKYPDMIDRGVINVPMSDYQFIEYSNIRFLEKKSEKGGKDSKTNLKKSKIRTTTNSMYRIYSRQTGNFVFPDDIEKPFLNPKFENKLKTKKSGKYRNSKNDDKEIEKSLLLEERLNNEMNELSIKQKQYRVYQSRLKLSLDKLEENKEKYLDIHGEELGKLSPKMKVIYSNIMNSPGLVLVYSQFVNVEGLGIFGLVLEANGYELLSNTNVFNDKPKYTVYSGKQTKEEREEILKIFTADDNKYGQKCKIILVSESGSQGLNLKNIRQVHIMEPFWHDVRIKQVIGRAVRYESHIDLPKEEQNVEIYRYNISFTPAQEQEFMSMFSGPKVSRERITSDEYLYLICQKKTQQINNMLHVMKEAAVDCKFNKPFNEDDITCFDLGNEDGLSYYPDVYQDIIHLPVSDTEDSKKKKFDAKPGILLKNGLILFKTKNNIKVFKKGNFVKYNPNKNLTKNDVKKQIFLDIAKGIVYDRSKYNRTKNLVELGKLNNNGKLI